MHTLWVREHNRIAAILKRLNPHWRPNQLYEETRRIVIAQVQHITYSEWLPIIIGPSLMNKLGINVLRNGYRNSYDPSVDPRIASEFSTAAFRFGHSLVQGIYRMISASGRQSTLILRNTFNAPGILQNNPEYVDGLVNALTLQNAQTLDSRITQELSNHLFETPSTRGFGMDLMSLNIQRGRDHAISTYNAMREVFGVGRARTFLDLKNTTPEELIIRIQGVYRSVDDIDLWIGGMTETSVPDGLLGPTFGNIVGRQFQVAQNGDRFFYDMGNQAGSFTPGKG
ncbi:Chorion peroxidase [Armadillidium nasatum]|uniref:Chorion peroxidase n=1 Tax=Armadillidium nasatum TaxID=96803 RepID=A0A5N5SLI2_9CRUS|nr:Chorion peroxidase [Armadillidium nasatum]